MDRIVLRLGGAALTAALPAALCAALTISRAASDRTGQDAPAQPAERILFSHGLDTKQGGAAGPLQKTLDLLRARLHRNDPRERREEVRPLPPVGSQLGLAVFHAIRAARAESGFAVDFSDELGLLRLYGFDARRGVDATFALKLENDKGGGAKEAGEAEEEDEELAQKIRGAVDALATALEAEAAATDAADVPPYVEEVRWLGDEDPVELGFRWEYVRKGDLSLAQVTQVLDVSSLGEAQLRRGDRIVAINGASVASPPLFGRAVGGLRPGGALEVKVARGEATLELKGKVQKASEVVPVYERLAIGMSLSHFVAEVGGTRVEVGGRGERAAATVVCLFDARRPDTLRDAPVLAWLRDHHPQEEVAIAGIAVHADATRLAALMQELDCGWPAAADPDGRMAEAERTITLPALLVADRAGVVRYRQSHGGNLQRALRQVLAAPR